MNRRRAAMLALLLPVGFLALPAGAASAAAAPISFVTMVGDTGDYVSGGQALSWGDGSGSVSLSGTSSGIDVSVSGGASGESYDLDVKAPSGSPLAVGSYDGAQRAPFAAEGRPGLDVYGDGRGCNQVTGRFTVQDVAYTGDGGVARLRMTYEEHCEGGTAALTGEISWQEPGDDALAVVPDEVAWPDTYPTVSARLVPVVVRNTGTVDQSVGAPSLIGAGAAAYSTAYDGCGTSVAAGGSCRLLLRFTPPSAGAFPATLQVPVGTTTQTVALSGTGIAGNTSWRMQSEAGDHVGNGATYAWTPSTATFTGSGSDARVQVGVSSDDGDFTATFGPGSDGSIVPGATYSASSGTNGSGASMSVSGDGRGCSTYAGTFTVSQLEVDDQGQLAQLSLTFVQHCDGGAALKGSIAYRASDPAQPVPTGTTSGPTADGSTPPAPVTHLEAVTLPGSLVLSWDDPSAHWATTEVRLAAGSVAPASVTDGTRAYVGSDSTLVLPVTAPGTDYAFAVFAENSSGAASTPVDVVVLGSDTSLAATATHVTAGAAVRLVGSVVGTNGKPLAGDKVLLYGRPAGSNRTQTVTALTTDRAGQVVVTLRPAQGTSWTLQFPQDATHLGSQAGPVTVAVSYAVHVATSTARAARGSSFTVSTRVDPAATGQVVDLQQLVGGAWRTVSTGRLSASSTYAWKVAAGSAKGVHRYRVISAAKGLLSAGTSPTVVVTVV